ncbi:MAG: histidine triad nucleotide-binding protein [Rickettsiaceae bacterium]|jgi:diadenosine tetraphosphate (Ap4A) HIT family hydrolase|nr:histidine triad nucleotide-binding protein [Rickettsiaceae bacterium]
MPNKGKRYSHNNIFAKIIRGEMPASKVYEDDQTLAFHDISKAAPTHILVVPKGQYSSFEDFTTKAKGSEIAAFFKTVKRIAFKAGLKKNGYRLIINNGENASQTVPHFHVHILGGRSLGGLLPTDNLSR